MKIEYKDFIGVFSDVYPEGFCEHLIEEIECNLASGAGTDRQNGEGAHKHAKDDQQLYLQDLQLKAFEGDLGRKILFAGLQECFDAYTTEFSTLQEQRISCHNGKMQKTLTGGGYHVWHGEQGSGAEAARGLVYMLYLNTLPEEANGETEFLYQQRRINPVKNTMVIWPASFTHAHRGNPVYGDNAKYIVTGWFYYD